MCIIVHQFILEIITCVIQLLKSIFFYLFIITIIYLYLRAIAEPLRLLLSVVIFPETFVR